MTLIKQKLAGILNGVSQQPFAVRPSSQAEVQENMLSHAVYGLRRRPPTVHVAKLGDLLADDSGSSPGGGTIPRLADAAGFDFLSDNAVFSTRTDVYNLSGTSVSALDSIPNSATAPDSIGTTLLPYPDSSSINRDVVFPARPELNNHTLLRALQAAGGRDYYSNTPGLNVPGMTLIAVLRPISTCPGLFGSMRASGSGYPYFAIGANGPDDIGGMCPGDLTGQTGVTGTYVGGGVVASSFLQSGSVFSGSAPSSPLLTMSSSPFDIVSIRIDGTTGHVDFTKNGYACPNTFTAPVGPYNFSSFHTSGDSNSYWDWARVVFWSRALTNTELTNTVRNLGFTYGITVA